MPPQRKRGTAADDAGECGGRKKRIIGNYCAVPGCSNYAGKTRGTDVSYHKFPSGPTTLRDLWIKSIRRGGVWNPDRSHVCSAHFKDEDFERDFKAELLNLKKRKMLKSGVIPSQNLPDFLEDEEEDSQAGCASANEDERGIFSSLPDEQIIVFEVGSSDNSIDGSECWGETNTQNSDDIAEEEVHDAPEQDLSKNLETPTSNKEDISSNEIVDRTESRVAGSQTKGTLTTFASCEQSAQLKAETNKLCMELKAKEDTLFILEQSSALQAKQHLRIIGELKVENDRLKTELREKNEKIATLEEALATDTKLRSIFSPDELKRFLKKAKRWSEM